MKSIFISGTPCVGKSTIAKALCNDLDNDYSTKLIEINKLAFDNDLILGRDVDKDYKIVDIDKLDKTLNNTLNSSDNDFVIVEGHLSQLCSGADYVIVLRVHPDLLKERLERRDYSNSKILENLESEALGVCSVEAYENYQESVNEIDVSDLSVLDAVNLIKDIIFNNKKFKVGSVEFSNWILNNL